MSYTDLEYLLFYAEKGEIAVELVPQQAAQIKDFEEKVEKLILKIIDLETFNSVLMSDNADLNKKLLKSKKKNQIFKILSISFGAITTIECVVLIIYLN